MDNFSNVYHDFYDNQVSEYTHEQQRQLGFREPLPRFTVEIVGVWETVGFQKAWMGKDSGERLELRNTTLHDDVKYAFHALALDEERTAFQPTLWHTPKISGDQELLQVWFCGAHTDVGGGKEDPRLSNIPLAWMIAHCMKHNQLSFDIDEYLFHHPPLVKEKNDIPWATSLGKVNHNSISRTVQGWIGGTSSRTPLQYKPNGSEVNITNEVIHESVKDRKLNDWRCPPLRAQDDKSWILTDGQEIFRLEAIEAEKYMKGRIRTVHVDQQD